MSLLPAAVRGAASGSAATVAMSALMLAAGRAGLVGRQPPEAIVRRAGDALGHEPQGAAAGALGSLAHLGFGASVGVVAALLPARGAGPARGVALSLLVYVASYRGWVPALGALPPADRDRPDRQAVLVTAHLVYGAVLGALDRRHRPPGSSPAVGRT